jgi:N-acylneuraminate cytidylyltransferase/CMP-N,N'-diacetyllegionaminic acid synthase
MERHDMGGTLALIPARGGSKGVARKNVRLLAGKPLITYTVEAAVQSAFGLRVVVSTDDASIAEVALAAGAEVPFLRPRELAQDGTPMLPVIQHALERLKQEEDYEPVLVVLLQPTSPLRTAGHIDDGIRLLLETGADSVMSVCEAEHSPYWMWVLDDEGRARRFVESDREYLSRQEAPPVYRPNGALYVTRQRTIVDKHRLLGNDLRALIMDRYDSVDIDDEVDFCLAELLMERRRAQGGC